MKKKMLSTLGALVGIVCIAFAAYYWFTPAGSLPHYLPGFEAGSSHIHFKHGLAAFILGLGLFVYAWFQGAPPKKTLEADQPFIAQENTSEDGQDDRKPADG